MPTASESDSESTYCPPSARPTQRVYDTQGLPDDSLGIFETRTFTPRQVAPFADSNHLIQSPTCVAASPDNPLGNPRVDTNRVARPFKECIDADIRSEDQRFLNQVYRTSASTTADYAFEPFPVKDFVEETDSFRKWVFKDTMTHCRDKYSNPESAGVDCYFDSVGPLGL